MGDTFSTSTVAQNLVTIMVTEKLEEVPKNSFFKPLSPTNISKNTIKTFINHLNITPTKKIK